MKYIIYLILVSLSVLLLSSCDSTNNPEPDDPYAKVDAQIPTPQCRQTLLIYSVAANNLLSMLRGDSLEMIKGAPNISGLAKDNRVLLYFASLHDRPTLSELKVGNDGKGMFELIKTYERDIPSTHPDRMRQVWRDVRYYRPADTYNMMLESHGTGWTPFFAQHDPVESSRALSPSEVPPMYSFGSDQSTGKSDQMDIIELSEVFEDGQLGFIWFDACYMAGVETVYQLRNKARNFVGYVTEIWSDGVPYDRVLPIIALPNPNLVSGAKTVYDYFNDSGQPVSVSVIDMAKMEDLAAATRPFAVVSETPYVSFLQNYARRPSGPFYDFGQYIGSLAEVGIGSQESYENFQRSLESVVIYKGLSDRDFNRNPFDVSVYSGLSTHVPGQAVTPPANEQYWFSTDWGKNVYGVAEHD